MHDHRLTDAALDTEIARTRQRLEDLLHEQARRETDILAMLGALDRQVTRLDDRLNLMQAVEKGRETWN